MRAGGYMRRPPRAWTRMQDSWEFWLTDSAVILRRVPLEGPTDFGTPRFRSDRLGPYAAKLRAPSGPEENQGDRHLQTVRYELSIMSDVPPRESELFEVTSDEGGRLAQAETHVYRAQGTVNPRPAPWGDVPIYNVEVERTTEA